MASARRLAVLALSLLFFLPAVSATCPFLDSSVTAQATAVQGVKANYALAFTNRDLNAKLIQVSGTCPQNAGCSFTPVPYNLLQPSTSTGFTLTVDTGQLTPSNYSISLDVNVDGQVCQSYTLGLNVNAPNPTTKPPFEVTVSPAVNASIRPTDTLTYQITIRNNQDIQGFARVSAESALPVSFSADDVQIDPNSEKVVTATVSPLAGTPRNRYDVLLTIDAFEGNGCCEHPFAIPRQVFVFSDKLDLALQNTPAPDKCIQAQHENASSYSFFVRNNGENPGPFEFNLLGLSGTKAFATLSVDLLEIKPGDTQEVRLNLNPSRSVDLGTYPLQLVASYGTFTVFQRPFCVTVDAIRSFRLDGPGKIQMVRGDSVQVNYHVTNRGTVRQVYSVFTAASPGFDVRLLTNSLVLDPGQTQNASVALATTLLTPLYRNQSLVVRIFDGNLTKTINTTIQLVSSTEPNRSFLDIPTRPVTAYAGITTKETVQVRNKLARTQHNVMLQVQGLPNGWASVKTSGLNILAGKTANYDVEFDIPDTANGNYPYTYFAQSYEGEQVQVPNVLIVKKPPAFLNVAVTAVVRRGDEVSFNVVVYNNGARPLNNVVVQASDKSLTLDHLAPGEQRIVSFQALAAAPLIVSARADDGIQSNSETVTPADIVSTSSFPDALIVAIVLLGLVLVSIAFMLRKEQLDHMAASG